MKFVADAMLGKLAKRLRLLGFDVLYDPACSDNDLIRLSREEDRTILTRDAGLASRPLAERHLFISSDHPNEQLRQVLDRLPAGHPPAPLTRCSVCNAPLAAIPKAEAVDLVPRHVYDHAALFLRCPSCGRIYWKGSHLRSMRLGGPAKEKPAS